MFTNIPVFRNRKSVRRSIFPQEVRNRRFLAGASVGSVNEFQLGRWIWSNISEREVCCHSYLFLFIKGNTTKCFAEICTPELLLEGIFHASLKVIVSM